MAIAEGIAKYIYLHEPAEPYQEGSPAYYQVTMALDDDKAKELEGKGVHLKPYTKGDTSIMGRKFNTQYPVRIIDPEGEPYQGPIPAGSKLRVEYTYGKHPSPVHGMATYLTGVRVLELGSEDSNANSEL